MKVRAWAKLNLFLEVTGKRDDGYHNIETLMVPISLYDEIDIRIAASMSVKFAPGVVPSHDNTILKAHRALRPGRNFRIRVKKTIPVFAGLGGGSSDAAAFMRATSKLPADKLMHIAQNVGSDVPFFLQEKTALCTGRGEIVTPVKTKVPNSYVVFDTGVKISTADAYRAVDSANGYARKDFLTTVMPFNRFQEILPDLSQELERIRRKLERKTGAGFHLTGSGGALYCCAVSRRICEAISSEGFKALKVRAIG